MEGHLTSALKLPQGDHSFTFGSNHSALQRNTSMGVCDTPRAAAAALGRSGCSTSASPTTYMQGQHHTWNGTACGSSSSLFLSSSPGSLQQTTARNPRWFRNLLAYNTKSSGRATATPTASSNGSPTGWDACDTGFKLCCGPMLQVSPADFDEIMTVMEALKAAKAAVSARLQAKQGTGHLASESSAASIAAAAAIINAADIHAALGSTVQQPCVGLASLPEALETRLHSTDSSQALGSSCATAGSNSTNSELPLKQQGVEQLLQQLLTQLSDVTSSSCRSASVQGVEQLLTKQAGSSSLNTAVLQDTTPAAAAPLDVPSDITSSSCRSASVQGVEQLLQQLLMQQTGTSPPTAAVLHEVTPAAAAPSIVLQRPPQVPSLNLSGVRGRAACSKGSEGGVASTLADLTATLSTCEHAEPQVPVSRSSTVPAEPATASRAQSAAAGLPPPLPASQQRQQQVLHRQSSATQVQQTEPGSCDTGCANGSTTNLHSLLQVFSKQQSQQLQLLLQQQQQQQQQQSRQREAQTQPPLDTQPAPSATANGSNTSDTSHKPRSASRAAVQLGFEGLGVSPATESPQSRLQELQAQAAKIESELCRLLDSHLVTERTAKPLVSKLDAISGLVGTVKVPAAEIRGSSERDSPRTAHGDEAGDKVVSRGSCSSSDSTKCDVLAWVTTPRHSPDASSFSKSPVAGRGAASCKPKVAAGGRDWRADEEEEEGKTQQTLQTSSPSSLVKATAVLSSSSKAAAQPPSHAIDSTGSRPARGTLNHPAAAAAATAPNFISSKAADAAAAQSALIAAVASFVGGYRAGASPAGCQGQDYAGSTALQDPLGFSGLAGPAAAKAVLRGHAPSAGDAPGFLLTPRPLGYSEAYKAAEAGYAERWLQQGREQRRRSYSPHRPARQPVAISPRGLDGSLSSPGGPQALRLPSKGFARQPSITAKAKRDTLERQQQQEREQEQWGDRETLQNGRHSSCMGSLRRQGALTSSSAYSSRYHSSSQFEGFLGRAERSSASLPAVSSTPAPQAATPWPSEARFQVSTEKLQVLLRKSWEAAAAKARARGSTGKPRPFKARAVPSHVYERRFPTFRLSVPREPGQAALTSMPQHSSRVIKPESRSHKQPTTGMAPSQATTGEVEPCTSAPSCNGGNTSSSHNPQGIHSSCSGTWRVSMTPLHHGTHPGQFEASSSSRVPAQRALYSATGMTVGRESPGVLTVLGRTGSISRTEPLSPALPAEPGKSASPESGRCFRPQSSFRGLTSSGYAASCSVASAGPDRTSSSTLPLSPTSAWYQHRANESSPVALVESTSLVHISNTDAQHSQDTQRSLAPTDVATGSLSYCSYAGRSEHGGCLDSDCGSRASDDNAGSASIADAAEHISCSAGRKLSRGLSLGRLFKK